MGEHFGFGDTIVAGDVVGLVIHEERDSLLVTTSRSVVEVAKSAPMRRAMREAAARERVPELARAVRERGEEAIAAHRLLIDEIARALFRSPRSIRAALRRGDATLGAPEAPAHLPYYEYVGAFSVARGLAIADPCYVERTERLLALTTDAAPGEWHAFVRADPRFSECNLALLVLHREHLDARKDAGRELGVFGVDSGRALVCDARARKDAPLVRRLHEDAELDEGLVGGVGCLVRTYAGDGMYRVRAIERSGAVVGVRVNLTDDPQYDFYEPPPDQRYVEAVARALTEAPAPRDYSPKAKFAAGERVKHAKFGEGVVTHVLPANKVEVAFLDGTRTLVHAR